MIATEITHIVIINSHGPVKSGDVEGALLDVYDMNFEIVEKIMKDVWEKDTAEAFAGSREECEEVRNTLVQNNVPVYIAEID